MKLKSYFSSLLALIFTAGFAFSQTQPATLKIGYTDPEYILALMPEYKQIESELKTYEKQLRAQMDAKMKDYQAKLEAYQKDVNTLPDIVKQDKEKELLNMQNNIKEFEENAMSSMQNKQNQLLDPVIQKIQKAINDVAAENGYNYIFSTSAGSSGAIILYSKDKSDDISELVLKKLGVTPPANTDSTKPANTAGSATSPTMGTGAPTKSTAPVKNK